MKRNPKFLFQKIEDKTIVWSAGVDDQNQLDISIFGLSLDFTHPNYYT